MKTMNNKILLLLAAFLMAACAGLNEINPEEYMGEPPTNQNPSEGDGQVDISVSEAVNLSSKGTANCYIVSKKGTYSISAVKGNSSESVGSISSVEVLWETFGTSKKPSKGDLVAGVMYKDGKIYFKTPDTFEEGNAVIAAKDASGTILWSWHIWLTDQPEEQVYANNAGTMMDRNLGATSATPGDVEALGLLYQWGRKDPFLGSSSVRSQDLAKSTISWPSAVESKASNGTIEYTITNPTTFIFYNSRNYDWQYSQDDTRWQSEKTIYDPCPVGWRVPDGGANSVWSNAGFGNTAFNGNNKGISISVSSTSSAWYPAPGCLNFSDGLLSYVGNHGFYWSITPVGDDPGAFNLYLDSSGTVSSMGYGSRAFANSVRCLQE